MGPKRTSKANSRPGAHATTTQSVTQRTHLWWLWPRNRAPTAGPFAPPRQAPRVVSGLHSPMRRTSEIAPQTVSADRSMWTELLTLLTVSVTVAACRLFCIRRNTSEGGLEVRVIELPAAARGVVGDRTPELASPCRAGRREVVRAVGEGEG